MKAYLNILKEIIDAPETEWKPTRTGIRCKTISGCFFSHHMDNGFPLLTTKKMGIKTIASELEFFIKGLNDKKWLSNRNNHIWDPWANPKKVPYGNDENTKKKMKEETDLGEIYGRQWRNFNNESGKNSDQLKNIVDTLHNNPSDRRMVCSAWNPNKLDEMALPPCHVTWHVTVTGENLNTLNLNWFQRSADVPLGIPFNIASYAILLILLSKEANMKPGKLTGTFSDTHIYENQIDIAKEQILREPRELPKIEISNFKNIFDWRFEEIKIKNYNPHPKLIYPIAV